MIQTCRAALLLVLLAIAYPVATQAQNANTKYKCMIQLTNYVGEGAYIVVSLVNKDDAYEKTLYVLGSDRKWYHDLKEWYAAYKKKPQNISAITGASVAGGDRSVVTLELDNDKINAGYKLRFESAVEDNKYYVKDLEVQLTTDGLAAKTDGTGYIRYVRFSAN
jgi:hypothetical protein